MNTYTTDGSGKGIIISFGFACMVKVVEWMDVIQLDAVLDYIKDGLYIVSMLIVIILGAMKLYKKLKK